MGQAKRKAAADPADSQLQDYKKKFALSQDLCEPARKEWVIDQGYYDGPGQWTDGERAILRQRGQPDTYFNDVKPAVNGMIGAAEKGKTDPRALGRTPKDVDAADVATDCLRYIRDANQFRYLESQARKDHLIQGIACFVTEIDERKEVKIIRGRPEAFFYDPYSREADFSDARWLGLANWMDEQDALALITDDDPKAEEKRKAITQSIDSGGSLGVGQTTEDRPQGGWSWADSKTRRLMVVQMWHRRGPIWYMCKFVSGGILESGESPYKDAEGKPRCQIRAQSCYVDGDNRRYGVVRDLRGPQDAQNKGWSKAIHTASVAKLRVDPGVAEVDTIRKEYARPDGIIEARAGQVEEIGDKQLLPAHIEFLQIAEGKMRRYSPTPASVGRQSGGASGRAQLVEQEAGATEQAPVMGNFDHLIMMVDRDCWACVKQFWNEPKYIRVTDDENAPKYVMMNAVDPKTGQPYTDENGQPLPPNRPAEMDVDIIIDKERDTAVLAEEQFRVMGEIETARPGTFSPMMLVEMSSLPRKRQIIDKMKAEQQEAQQNKPPGPEQQEQAKAAIQLQAKQQQLQMDAQAHEAQLMRDDQADERKAQRAAALEDQRFQNKQRELNAQAVRDHQKREADFHHQQRTRQSEFEFGQQQENAKAAQTAEKESQAKAQKDESDGQIAQALAMIAQSQQETAKALAMLGKIVAAPRKIENRNGQKISVPDLGAMN